MKIEKPLELISLADIKTHLRVVSDIEDELITSYVMAAVSFIESECKILLGECTITDTITNDKFNIHIFNHYPFTGFKTFIDSEGVDITPIDTDLTLSTLKDIAQDFDFTNNSITVTYTAGYDPVPSDLMHALRLMVGSFYNFRESEVVGNVKPNPAVALLLNNYRRGKI
jgi:hypothetical protein